MDDERPEGIYAQRNNEHLKSFEEVRLGNPGQRRKEVFQLRTGSDSWLKYRSHTIGHREQHLIRKASGMLYIFKTKGKTLSFRRCPFDVQHEIDKVQPIDDPAVDVQFDAEIAEGLHFEVFSTPGEFICSLMVPLLNSRIVQLFFTARGIKKDTRGGLLTTEMSLIHPFLDQKKALQQGEVSGLLAVEPLGYTGASKEQSVYASGYLKMAATHGDSHICIYEVPLNNSPENTAIQVKGGAIACGTKLPGGVWNSFKEVILNNRSSMDSKSSTDEIIEDLKYIGNNLICLVVLTQQFITEIRVVNMLSQNVICRKELTSPPYEYFYQVGLLYKR